DNHTSSQPTAWVLTDGTLTADKIPSEGVIQVASSDGAELVRILGGSSGSDTLEVATGNAANVEGTIYQLEGNNRIELSYGTILMEAGDANTYEQPQVIIDFDDMPREHVDDGLRVDIDGAMVPGESGGVTGASADDVFTLTSDNDNPLALQSVKLMSTSGGTQSVVFTAVAWNTVVETETVSFTGDGNFHTVSFSTLGDELREVSWSLETDQFIDDITAIDNVTLDFWSAWGEMTSHTNSGFRLA
ncbi:MAG: hypothetical protein GY842_08045, partial [bacterium]|nr:hypothetical protein [bacterium]